MDSYKKFTDGPIRTKVIYTSIFPIVFFIICLIVEVFIMVIIFVVFENTLFNHFLSSIPVFVIILVLSLVPYGIKFKFDINKSIFISEKVAIFPMIWSCKNIKRPFVDIDNFSLKTLRKTNNKGFKVKELLIEVMAIGDPSPIVLCSFKDETIGDNPDCTITQMILDMNQIIKATTINEELGLSDVNHKDELVNG